MTVFESWQNVIDVSAQVPELHVRYQNLSDPFDLNQIGAGYDTWTKSETQLLMLAVLLVMIMLALAIIVALDCGRQCRLHNCREDVEASIKAPPLSVLAPPPYTERQP
ncbi:unnamed protein product [Caenorhabditis auriculariae]|uniref:Uncharacterized protein n=1 Tax=Caenorhabditis auriculariae TaxID=2777116 RepID=A0A8S1HU32_9PELO|nr:unnamed protein product [Caenorhabditis auriculariae]